MAIPFEEPIIILGSPRSGTSLTAQIFEAHGVWVGTSKDRDQWNPHGYCENNMLHVPRLIAGHGDGLDRELVHELIITDGYTGGPWLVKHSPLTWRAWRQFNPHWVFVWRDMEQIIQSRLRCGLWNMSEAEHRVSVETDHALMRAMHQHIGGKLIWPQHIIDHYFDGLRRAFEYCEIELNITTVNACLDPSIWNNSGDSDGQ